MIGQTFDAEATELVRLGRQMNQHGAGVLFVRHHQRERVAGDGLVDRVISGAATELRDQLWRRGWEVVLIKCYAHEKHEVSTRDAMLTTPFVFTTRIRNVKRFEPIHASLELIAELRGRFSRTPYPTDRMVAERHSDFFEITGTGRAQLETLLRTLAVDHHREILTTQRKVRCHG